MAQSWKITAFAPRPVIEAALIAHEDMWDWDHDIVIAGFEVADDRPEEWQLEAWLPRKPSKQDKAAIKALFAQGAPKLSKQRLAEVDWVTQSQQGIEPIRAGRFYIHTPDHPSLGEPGVRDFCVPASRAYFFPGEDNAAS